MTPNMMTTTVDLGDGNDQFFGGEGGSSEIVTGGLGNDMIQGGLGWITSKLYGDQDNTGSQL